jgi:hypothetical protein
MTAKKSPLSRKKRSRPDVQRRQEGIMARGEMIRMRPGFQRAQCYAQLAGLDGRKLSKAKRHAIAGVCLVALGLVKAEITGHTVYARVDARGRLLRYPPGRKPAAIVDVLTGRKVRP